MTLAAVTLFAACGNTKQPTGADPHAAHNHTSGEGQAAVVGKTDGAVHIKDDKLNAVYQHYSHLTTALVNADLADAKIAAIAIELGAKVLANSASLTATAAKIAAATDINTQRTLFAELSNDFITRVKSSGLTAGEVYVEYCPMALNDKGASWLSNQKEIRNPYFGESMMTCGEVKETIK